MNTKSVKIGLMSSVLLGACVFWVLTMPRPLTVEVIVEHDIDLQNGETLFWAGGCASCHAAPETDGEDRLKLVGGVELVTPFGIFRAPNISPDKKVGIGGWTTLEFINAMVKGISPDGKHYYPAFPYTNYQKMKVEDLIDLKSYLDSLPAVESRIQNHDLKFPFSFRRGLGLWKLLYLDGETFVPDETLPKVIERGRYLVQGPGHCGACHTARDIFGGEKKAMSLAGAPTLENDKEDGEASVGYIPNITPHKDGIGEWTVTDIEYSLESGFDPDFDSFGGSMVEVQGNMANLSAADRAAIAAYLKSIPAIASDRGED